MRRTALFLLLALVALAPGSPSQASDVHVVRAEHLGRGRPAEPLNAEPSGPVREVPIRRPKPRRPDSDQEVARAASTQQVAATKTPVEGVDVIGARFTGVVPPDPAGEAGHTQYVHTFNTARGAGVRVFDKTGLMLGSFLMSTLAPPGDCEDGLGDGVPLYDEVNQRWILTELSAHVTAVCVYVSTTSNALGAYESYIIEFMVFPDYPKWGIAGDALYLGFNNSGFLVPLVAMNYAKMRGGLPLADEDVIVEVVDPLEGFGFQLMTPVDVDGATPYTGPGIFVRHRDDEVHDPAPDATKDFIEYVEMTPNFATGIATVDGPNAVEVSEFDSRLCGLFSISCVPQRGTRRKLDPLREVIMNRPVLRVVGTDQVLVGSFAVDVGVNRAGVRWFEFHRPAAAPTTWTVASDGVLDGVGRHRWIPSIAVNDDGDVALGFSESGKRVFPSMRVTGRLAGDPAGTMPQAETVLASSKAAQTIASRWGDYSEMSVDPSDPGVFWYTNEVIDRRGRWMTRIGSFTLEP